jgi:hypothetical protein
MKHTKLILLSSLAILSVGCNPKKTAIEKDAKATKEAIDVRKDEVDAAAKEATKQTDANAEIDKARIEAGKVSDKAELDADKKKADAEADAEKAKVDARER